jgi:NAD(P)H-dependent FMN reductase
MVRGEEVRLIDIAEAKSDLLNPASYDSPPKWFRAFLQEPVLEAKALVFVVPEYNGSFPGALKLAIDHLEFPASLRGKPALIIACSSGQGGGIRASEHLGSVLSYRRAHVFGERAIIPDIENALAKRPEEVETLLRELLVQFVSHVKAFSAATSKKSGNTL